MSIVCTAQARPTPQETLDVAAIAKRSVPGIALIEVRDASGRQVAVGSGFVADSAGLVVSSLHVFESAASATIKFARGAEFADPRVVAFDRDRDLISLRVDSRGLSPLSLNRKGGVEVGEKIVVIGNPEGLSGTVSDGIISSVRSAPSGELYQITAPVSPGSSGGPVLNRKGEVIGVIAFTIRAGQNLNFAVPIRYVFPLLQKGTSMTLSQLSEHLVQAPGSGGEVNGQLPVTASGYYRRGLDLYGQGKPRDAVDAFKRAIEVDPSRAESYFQIGSILANELQSRDQAIAYLQKGLKILPEDSVAHSLLAVLYRQDRRYNDSIAESKTAIGLSPLNPAFHFVLGVTFAECERHDEAIAELRQAIQLRPSYALAYYEAALSYEKVGDNEAASRAWRAFLRLASGGPAISAQVRTAREHLARLESRP